MDKDFPIKIGLYRIKPDIDQENKREENKKRIFEILEE